MKISLRLFFCSLPLLAVSNAVACDSCRLSMPSADGAAPSHSGFYGGVSEQFTRFGTLQLDGREVADPSGQYLNSSILQVFAGYRLLGDRLSVQVGLPLIHRSYQRPEGLEIERGRVAGAGDLTLLASYQVFEFGAAATPGCGMKNCKEPVAPEASGFRGSLSLLAGLKLPTGDSRRLKEEQQEGHHGEVSHEEGAHEEGAHEEGAHGEPHESGIHGHDLTLGTGSYDAIFGGELVLGVKALFFQAGAQFTLRGDGRHSYHFANELSWHGGPGVYLSRRETSSVALQWVVSGEYKDTDRFQGRSAADTGMTSVFTGPRLAVSRGALSAEFAVELPLLRENTALQVVADYRLRAGISLQF